MPPDRPESPNAEPFDGPHAVRERLARFNYLADRGLATSLYLAATLGQPLLLEGAAGVGKTELAKATAACTNRQLLRLQCYEGMDVGQALYEWDYSRQLLFLRTLSDTGADAEETFDNLFGPKFLIERPILAAIRKGSSAVLLIDEIDRADDEFEALLLEVLSDFQITIPELGPISAATRPLVILTSNRTRELHDALKRRCLYHWIDYPDIDREIQIVKERAPEVALSVVQKVATYVSRIRELDLIKTPGIAETIVWARALGSLGLEAIETDEIADTLGAILKEREDVSLVTASLAEILSGEPAA